jgi:hypothetical protein
MIFKGLSLQGEHVLSLGQPFFYDSSGTNGWVELLAIRLHTAGGGGGDDDDDDDNL